MVLVKDERAGTEENEEFLYLQLVLFLVHSVINAFFSQNICDVTARSMEITCTKVTISTVSLTCFML